MKIGICSNSSKRAFEFDVLEIQRTFYEIIKEDTARKWREKAPKDFEFAIKCFQGITHPKRSPTWRKSNVMPSENVGYLNFNSETLKYWKHTLKIAEILNSKVILVQLPFSFKENEENIEKIYNFFENVERKDFKIAIELRGWSFETIKKVCKDLDLIDVFDPLVRDPARKDFLYIRLHGKIEGRKINYKYKYSDEELKEIIRKIREINPNECYVLFNNVYMFEDAKRLLKMVR